MVEVVSWRRHVWLQMELVPLYLLMLCRLDLIYEETEELFKRSVASKEMCELRNMINVGYLIMRQAMERKESRGLHYTIDYPHHEK